MITILTQPSKVSPAFNQLMISVTSDEQTRADFKYIIQVKDGAGNTISTLKKVGGSSVDYVTEINVSDILARIQFYDAWRYSVTGTEYIYFDSKFRPGYNVVISEYYDASTQDTETVTDLFTIPAALHEIKFPFYNYEAISNAGKWLTNFESIRLRANDKVTVSFLQPTTAPEQYEFWFYDNSGTQIANVSKVNPFEDKPEDVIHFHAGLPELAAFLSLSPSIVDDVAYYILKPKPVGIIDLTPRLRFDIVNQSCKFPGARLHYLNEWGAVDSFLFGLAHRRGTSIEKKKAKLLIGGSQLRSRVYGAGSTPYMVSFTDEMKLNSDYITDNDSNTLLELFTSPIVSLEIRADIFVPGAPEVMIVLPCDIDLSKYDIKQSRIEKLFNLDVDVKISVDNQRQLL